MESSSLLTSVINRIGAGRNPHFAGVSFFRAVSLVLGCQLLLSVPAAFSQSANLSSEEAEVERLTNEILHKEVDLERYYLQYRQYGTASPRFRRIRYFLLQVASTSCTMASNIVLTDVAHKGLRNKNVDDFGLGDGDVDPTQTSATGGSGARSGGSSGAGNSGSRASASSASSGGGGGSNNTVGEVRKGITLAIIGTVLGPGSSLLELSSNGFTVLKNLAIGKNPASAVRNVETRVKEIDDLMEQRVKLIDEHPELRALHINRAEHQVLQCFRDWCVSEFVDVYADVKSAQAGANAFYILDVTAGSLALTGNLLGLRSTYSGKDGLAGPAATVSVVGDGFGIISAPASAYAGKRIRRYWHGKMQKHFSDHLNYDEADANLAMDGLQNTVAVANDTSHSAAGAIDSRVAAYLMWSRHYDRVVQRQEIELHHRSKVAIQGQRIGPMIGATALTQDTLADVAFYGARNNEKAGAALSYAGGITAITGNAAALAYTNSNFINQWLYTKKLCKKNLHPDQLLAERFKMLDHIDQMVTTKDIK